MRPALSIEVALLAVLAAGPTLAQTAGCNGFIWSVEREQAAFAGGSLPTLESGTTLPGVGHAATLALARQDTVSFPVAPSRKPKHDAPYAGVFPLTVAAADTYQVTVSDDAWIEVAQGGKLLKQVGFTGSHTCSTVHKSVRFDLVPGTATLEISDAGKDSIKVEVVPRVQE